MILKKNNFIKITFTTYLHDASTKMGLEMRVKNMVIKYGFTITSNAEINIFGKV